MVRVGSFESLQPVLRRARLTDASLEIHTWVQTKLDLISPLVDWLMNLITASRCVQGSEDYIELALREALRNAMLHGNRLNRNKRVDICCHCKSGKGLCLDVRDQERGFDPRNGTEVHLHKASLTAMIHSTYRSEGVPETI